MDEFLLMALFCSPGAIYTPIQADTRKAEQMANWGSKGPLGRPGEPSEVAPTFVFLASADASLYCTCYLGIVQLGSVAQDSADMMYRWADHALLSTG